MDSGAHQIPSDDRNRVMYGNVGKDLLRVKFALIAGQRACFGLTDVLEDLVIESTAVAIFFVRNFIRFLAKSSNSSLPIKDCLGRQGWPSCATESLIC